MRTGSKSASNHIGAVPHRGMHPRCCLPNPLTKLATQHPSPCLSHTAAAPHPRPHLAPPTPQMDSTEERLKEEKEMLSGTLKYLSAQAALQGAFRSASTGSGESPVPPPGGPD